MIGKEIRVWLLNHPIWTIAIFGILLRLLIACLYQYITTYPDTYSYFGLSFLFEKLSIAGYEGQRSPGYPLFLFICRNSLLVVVIAQLAIGVVTQIFQYKTLLVLGVKANWALITTLIIGCYIPTIFFEFAILSESLTLLFITLTFYTLFKIVRQGKSRFSTYFGLAILCTVLVLIKPFYIYLAAILFLILLLYRRSLRTRISRVFLILILPLLAFLGWSYVNKVNTGYFVSTTYYGFNLAQNCVSFAENTTPEYAEIGEIYAAQREINISKGRGVAMSIWEVYSILEKKTQLSFPDLSKKLYDYSTATIQLNPLAYAKQVAISWIDFWKTSLYWEYNQFAVSGANVLLKYICYAERIIFQLIKICFVLLIPFHSIRSIRRRSISPQMIVVSVVFVGSVLQAMVTYGTNSRFSFPFEMLIFTSVLLDVINRKSLIKQKS